MKKVSTTFIIALIVTLGFSACSKDKSQPDPEPKEGASLQGKWNGTVTKYAYYFDKTLLETETGPNVFWDYVIFNSNDVIVKANDAIGELKIANLTKTYML